MTFSSSLLNKRENDYDVLEKPEVFTWVSMSKGNSCTMCHSVLLSLGDELETSERCLVLLTLTCALILTDALGEYGLTELTSGLQHQA